MTGRGRWRDEAGAIPFVLIGIGALGSVLGAAWVGHEWSQRLLGEAGGELTVWVLRGAFWAMDLVALQAATEPVNADWYTPVLEGPAVPLLVLAAVVMVATLIAEVITGMVQGNTTRIVTAVFRALIAGMLATVAASLLLAIGGALSEIGRAALAASGTSVDAPLIPLQEVLMDTAEQREGAGVELFIAFLAGLVIVFTSLSIYFLLAMRPVVLAAIIVFLPIAHALSVWEPMRRIQMRVWSLAFAVLLAEAAILTMFAVANTAMGQPEGVDRLIFGTFGLLLAALSPAALARIVGAPELHSAVQTMSRGSKALAVGAGFAAVKGGHASLGHTTTGRGGGGSGGGSASALDSAGPAAGGGGTAGTSGPGGGSGGPGQGGGGGASGGAARGGAGATTGATTGATSAGSGSAAGSGPAGGGSAGGAASGGSSGGAAPGGVSSGDAGRAGGGAGDVASTAGANASGDGRSVNPADGGSKPGPSGTTGLQSTGVSAPSRTPAPTAGSSTSPVSATSATTGGSSGANGSSGRSAAVPAGGTAGETRVSGNDQGTAGPGSVSGWHSALAGPSVRTDG